MKQKISLSCICLLIGNILVAQVSFKAVLGKKANYKISIPSDYIAKTIIGENVDLKFTNSEGATIVTVVNILPTEYNDNDILEMEKLSDYEVIEQFEARGMFNVTLLKKGILKINGVNSFYTYCHDNLLYYHSITQFKKRKIINLTYTCEYSKLNSYSAYIFRVVNSLKHF